MKKFDRLPLQQRKEEIMAAAMELFRIKGFAATTMENIVQQVSLSKGGVYRIYPSTSAILGDLILSGMHLRNAYYEQRIVQEQTAGNSLTPELLVRIIAESLLMYPQISSIYVEFLWEKQRNAQLESLYQQICDTTVRETTELIKKYGAGSILLADDSTLRRLTDAMNGAILSLHVLNLRKSISPDSLSPIIMNILQNEP